MFSYLVVFLLGFVQVISNFLSLKKTKKLQAHHSKNKTENRAGMPVSPSPPPPTSNSGDYLDFDSFDQVFCLFCFGQNQFFPDEYPNNHSYFYSTLFLFLAIIFF